MPGPFLVYYSLVETWLPEVRKASNGRMAAWSHGPMASTVLLPPSVLLREKVALMSG